MPAGTPVDRIYKALPHEGHTPESAVKIAQGKTGLALATGKPPGMTRQKKTIKGVSETTVQRKKYA